MRRFFLLVCLAASTIVSAQAPFPDRSPEAIYANSRSLFDRELFSAASEGFTEVIGMVPAQSDLAEQSHCFRVLCAIRLMNRDSEELVRGFLATYPTSARRVELILEMAEYSFNRRRYKDSRDWLRELDGIYLGRPKRAEIQFKLGYSHFLLEEYDEARAQFAAAKATKYPIAASAQYYYGHIAYRDSNDMTALENFEPLQNHAQFGPVVPYYLAQIYARNEMDDKLLELGKKLLSSSTTRRAPEIAKLIGQSLYRKARYEEALPYLELHRNQGGKMFLPDHYTLGVVYYKSGRYQEAMQAFNKITGASNDMAQNAYYLLGDCYVRSGQMTEAQTAFQSASQMDFDLVIKEEAAYQAAKLMYSSSSPFGNAIAAFQKFLKDYPQTEHRREANEYLANLYITSKDYAKAMTAIQQTGMSSMAMREAYQRVAYYRAVEFYHRSDWLRAKEFFQKSMTYPQNLTFVALTHFWMGELSYRKGEYQEALAQFEAFLKTPGSYTLKERPLAMYNKAYCLYQLDQLEQAAAVFRLYLDDAPKTGRRTEDALLRTADLNFLLGRHEVAQRYYGQAVDLHGEDWAYAQYQQAMCLGLSQRVSEKITLLRKLENHTGRYAEDALFERATTHFQEGQNDEAVSAYRQFANLKPNTDRARRAELNVGLAQRNAGANLEAVATFKQFVGKYPGTPESKEAVEAARGVYDALDDIDAYVDWVQGLAFVNVRATALDSVSYMAAYDKYALAQYHAGHGAFTQYLKRFPEGYFANEAMYLRAECYRMDEQYEKALQDYERVARYQAPENQRRNESWLWSMKIAAALKKDVLLREAAYQVLSFSEDADDLRMANVHLLRTMWGDGLSAANQGDLNDIKRISKIVANDDRNTPQARTEARLIEARALKYEFAQMGATDSAHVAAMRQAFGQLKADEAPAAQAEASYELANLLREVDHDYTASNEEIFWLIDHVPGQAKSRNAAVILLAKNYADLNDWFQANYTLDFIIEEGFSESIVAEAKTLKVEFERRANTQPVDQDSTITEETPEPAS